MKIISFSLHHAEPCPEEEVLRVGFAGVAVGRPEAMEQWLSGYVGRRVWCTLLGRDQRMAQCVVHTRRKVGRRARRSAVVPCSVIGEGYTVEPL